MNYNTFYFNKTNKVKIPTINNKKNHLYYSNAYN